MLHQGRRVRSSVKAPAVDADSGYGKDSRQNLTQSRSMADVVSGYEPEGRRAAAPVDG